MFNFVEQGSVISNLNAYLEWNQLPHYLDEEGVCHGLASVYAKYVLEGRRADFIKMLKYVAGMTFDPKENAEVNRFVMDILMSCSPALFDKQLSQYSSMGMLSLSGKPISPTIQFALSTNDENWEQLIKQLNLQENDVMRISSLKHTVAVSKIKDKYIIYDPNYLYGFATLKDEASLIEELHHDVFGYEKGSLGMVVALMRDNAAAPRKALPTATEIYDTYLVSGQVNNTARLDGKLFHSLSMAAAINDPVGTAKAIALGASDESQLQAAVEAVFHNSPDALAVILSKRAQWSEKETLGLFLSALKKGQAEVFNVLLTHERSKKNFYSDENCSTLRFTAEEIYSFAAKSRSPLLLEKVISIYNFSGDKTYDYHAHIITAISSGSAQCVKLLIEQSMFDDIDKTEFLIQAIKDNKPAVALFLLSQIPKDHLNTISMSVRAARNTDIMILNLLTEHGYQFSDLVKKVILEKKHESVGVMTSLGIKLAHFADFCCEWRGNQKGISLSSEDLGRIRGQVSGLRDEPPNDEADAATPTLKSGHH